jgi:hypothetical protein
MAAPGVGSPQADQKVGVVELGPGLFQLAFVHLQSGIKGGILLDPFEEAGIDPDIVVARFVTLFERFCAQRLVG